MTRGCCATCPHIGEALARSPSTSSRAPALARLWWRRCPGGRRPARLVRAPALRPAPTSQPCASPPPGESMPAPPVVSAPEGVGGAARPRRASPRPRRPGAGSTCRCTVIHCGRGVRGSRFGDVTWARISPGGLARIERRWISSLRARIVRAEADCVALTWHYASRARSVLVPARASPARAGPGPGIGWKPVRGRRGPGPGPGPRPIPPRPGPRDRRVTREHVT